MTLAKGGSGKGKKDSEPEFTGEVGLSRGKILGSTGCLIRRKSWEGDLSP